MLRAFCGSLFFACASWILAAEMTVPAFTAYTDPNANACRFNDKSGLSGWKGPEQKVSWFGELKVAGPVECVVTVRLPKGEESKLRLTVAGQAREVKVTGEGATAVTAKFGEFTIKQAGYQRFQLESLNATGKNNGDLESLVLSGAAVEGAHFNLKPRRNAASVHLAYPVPKDTQVAAFYCEATGLEDPVATYYMATGWHRGYFGMQVNSPTERRIIFSVWDSGGEAIDRNKVADENRVKLMGKGEGVDAGDFGNEGTGGHSHWVYNWKTGEKQRFVVTAEPTENKRTIFSGFYFHPEKKEWMLISSWSAPKDGGYLHGLYSFSENFGGANGHLVRKARFGNQWIRTPDGTWTELTKATFSHDSTGKSDRLDRFMGVENGEFFLSQGGFVPGFTKYGEPFTRPAVGTPPVLKLPEIKMPEKR